VSGPLRSSAKRCAGEQPQLGNTRVYLLKQSALPQVYGPESSGKTTLALHAIAEVQRQGGTAALIDAEHAFDPEYSRVLPAGRVPREPRALWLALLLLLCTSC
jgi:hypothetical protein